MYWIHWNPLTQIWQIERNNLDGSERKSIYENGVMASLAMDYDSKRLYFVYERSGIAFYDLMSRKVRIVIKAANVMTITSVTIYNGTIYFPENIQSVIMSCDKDQCSEYTILRKNTSEYYLKDCLEILEGLF